MNIALTHLQRLEAESIHIFREVAAAFAKPVMLDTALHTDIWGDAGAARFRTSQGETVALSAGTARFTA